VEAHSPDDQLALARVVDPGPERPQCAQRGLGVLRVEVVLDRHRLVVHRAEQRGTVGDRLVRGRGDLAAERAVGGLELLVAHDALDTG
jgi:hypothetical protein